MYNYSNLRTRCDAYAKSVNNRARKLCGEAGLSPDLLGVHPHNAMVSYKSGKPWRGVDYAKVRKVLWLTNERQFLAHRALDRLYRKHGYAAFDFNN